MCGIIGYIGSKPVVPVLIEGLRKMEYRGYDSAGVALVSPEGIALRRSAGKLINLENVIQADPVSGMYGVGHTRWATHGAATEANAHPHVGGDQTLAIVHNGVIENYQTTEQVPEALLRLTEAYLSLGVREEAQQAAAVLGYNYLGSDWYRDAYAIVEGKPMPAAASGNKPWYRFW